MARFLLCAFLCLALGACGGTQRVTPNLGLTVKQKVETGMPVFLCVPADGKYGNITYPGTGPIVASLLKTAIEPKVSSVTVGASGENCQRTLQSAKKTNARYLFCPVIKHWEDRDTPWTGIPDNVVIEMLLYDVKSEKLLSAMTVSATSTWGILTNYPPEALLPQAFAEYVAKLF